MAVEKPVETSNLDQQRMNRSTYQKAVIATLYGQLERDNSLTRCCAIRALGRLKVEDVAVRQRLIELLRDPDPDVRLDAVVTLGDLGTSESVDSLIETLLGDPEGEVRIEAARSLSKLRSPAAVDALIRCVREDGLPQLDLSVDDLEFGDSLEVQGQALEALGCIGDRRATAPVIELLSDPDYEDLQENGFRVLSRLDDTSARAFLLAQMTNGNNRLARRRAAQAIAGLVETKSGKELLPDIVNALIGALLDTEPDVRISAAQALAGVDHPLVVVPLTLLLTDIDLEVRAQAAEILVSVRAPGVVDRLLQMLDGADIGLKARIAVVLGRSGEPSVVPALQEMLATDDESLRYQAVSAFGVLALPGPEIDLAGILSDQAVHANTRARAAAALGSILSAVDVIDAAGASTTQPAINENRVPEGVEPEQALTKAVFDPNQAVAQAALTALVAIMSPPAATGFLISLLGQESAEQGDQDRSPEVLSDAPTPLLEPDSAGKKDAADDAVPAAMPEPLEQMAGEPSAQASTLAAILSEQQSAGGQRPEHSPGMDDKLVTPTHSLQVLAASLLGELSDPGPEVVSVLIETLDRDDPRLVREALAALRHIGDPTALQPILRCLESGNEDTRLAAIDALAGIGGQSSGAATCKPLVDLLDDPRSVVRDWAVRALGANGGALATQHLPRMLDDEDRTVCRGVMASLTPEMASPELSRRMVDTLFRFSAELRHDTAIAMKRLNDFGSTPQLLKILRDKDQEAIHWICIDALGEIHAPAQIPAS